MFPRLIKQVDQLSSVAFLVEVMGTNPSNKISKATGFMFEDGGRHFLVTAWHVVAGFDPLTNRRLDKNQATPTTLECHLPYLAKAGSVVVTKYVKTKVSLYNDKTPVWFIHPNYGNKVDVVALELSLDAHTDLMPATINSSELENHLEDTQKRPGDDVFILGFPLPVKPKEPNLPIWKRGSIASEPYVNLDGLPKMLVDIASRPGMSGGPAIHQQFYIANSTDIIHGNLAPDDTLFGLKRSFCGIYSGRMNVIKENRSHEDSKDTLDTQLGIIWRPEVVISIINGVRLDTGYYPDKLEDKP